MNRTVSRALRQTAEQMADIDKALNVLAEVQSQFTLPSGKRLSAEQEKRLGEMRTELWDERRQLLARFAGDHL